MKDFKGKVAVITGAANGIGRSLAMRCAQEGLKLVLADIDPMALSQTQIMLSADGATVLSVVTDVSDGSQVEALAEKTLERFGAVHLLFNNAGVALVGPAVWEYTPADWKWLLGVNLWGVIHGIRVFVPIMLEQESNSHIINTASGAGLLSNPYFGAYSVTKHAVVTLSETLHHELLQKEAKIKVSLLCPRAVNTKLFDLSRYTCSEAPESNKDQPLLHQMQEITQAGMSPTEVADAVFEAIRNEKFYILTHPEVKEGVRTRLEDILQEQLPTNPKRRSKQT